MQDTELWHSVAPEATDTGTFASEELKRTGNPRPNSPPRKFHTHTGSLQISIQCCMPATPERFRQGFPTCTKVLQTLGTIHPLTHGVAWKGRINVGAVAAERNGGRKEVVVLKGLEVFVNHGEVPIGADSKTP